MTQANFSETKIKLLEKIETLSNDYQQLVLEFVEFLHNKQKQNQIIQAKSVDIYSSQQKENQLDKPTKRGGYGILKGKIWMSDDFDEPLEDLAEYM